MLILHKIYRWPINSTDFQILRKDTRSTTEYHLWRDLGCMIFNLFGSEKKSRISNIAVANNFFCFQSFYLFSRYWLQLQTWITIPNKISLRQKLSEFKPQYLFLQIKSEFLISNHIFSTIHPVLKLYTFFPCAYSPDSINTKHNIS